MKPYRVSDRILIDVDQLVTVEYRPPCLQFTMKEGRCFEHQPRDRDPITIINEIEDVMMGRRPL